MAGVREGVRGRRWSSLGERSGRMLGGRRWRAEGTAARADGREKFVGGVFSELMVALIADGVNNKDV
jgi:hypothetical protein